MTDQNKNQLLESKKTNSKLWLVYIMLILGVGILVALYVNFQFTYKVNDINQKISELNLAKKITNFTKSALPLEEAAPIIEENNKIEVKSSYEAFCSDLLRFTQNFYLMKLDAEKGNDFTAQILELNQYASIFPEIKPNLDNLIHLSPQNKAVSYYKLAFHNLIRDLYKKSDDYRFFNLSNYIFIRSIGERALKSDGLDRQVFLIEQALNQNNLKLADEYLQELSLDIGSLNKFRMDIKNQLVIQDSLNDIEGILLNKSNSNIVTGK